MPNLKQIRSALLTFVVPRPAKLRPETEYRDLPECYLIGQSDIDARWYYERRSWHAVG